MRIELTEQDVELIQGALNNVPVKGADAMVRILQLLQKLQEAKDDRRDVEANDDGNFG